MERNGQGKQSKKIKSYKKDMYKKVNYQLFTMVKHSLQFVPSSKHSEI